MSRAPGGGQSGPDPARDAPRPDGALVWGHATQPDHVDAMAQLAGRLRAQRPGVTLLLTATPEAPLPETPRAGVIHAALPADRAPAVEAFLAHWRPDLCLWAGGDLRPVLIAGADRRGVPLYLIDADEGALGRSGWRWLPDAQRSALGRFMAIHARSDAAARHVRRMGVPERDVTVSGVFREGAVALPHDEGLRAEMAEGLRGRPVWLAAMVQPDEIGLVLDAHRAVSRLAHRLFLVLVPDDVADAPDFIAALDAGGWRYTVWSGGAMPEETTQVLLADTRGEMGLWYRLATITLMASSFGAGRQGRDPNEPAAHGSAIMYGPNVRRYLDSYRRYAEAGGARIVRDSETLAAALGQLIAPDRSALMAHAAWDVATTGARVTDQIVDLVQDTLDLLEAG
ncbi:3-deoxy-D-manno-octulosonic acid transferase [Roseovarius spongiae]|uniref:3-deoxy-D-manno-octulosonic acid transferase n=1 Tax=Roseovarius spongiae TaxID=2320272 RepID=A0A3A8B8L7_9RHOB|nr:glycosyltransferase N-terminal domain-containing protein [Roseovarius spongiae]RKF13896.1 3-deoxy-D-manno-octulosonic acid transferase [Roseovarius spongiae]